MDTNFTDKLKYFLKIVNLHKADMKLSEFIAISDTHLNCNKRAVGVLISISNLNTQDHLMNLLKSHAKVLLTATL